MDDESIDWKLFPRAAALAERLWSNPTEKWHKAERRMLWQRLRNVRRELDADVLQVYFKIGCVIITIAIHATLHQVFC